MRGIVTVHSKYYCRTWTPDRRFSRNLRFTEKRSFVFSRKGLCGLRNYRTYLIWVFMLGINATYSIEYHKRTKRCCPKTKKYGLYLAAKHFLYFISYLHLKEQTLLRSRRCFILFNYLYFVFRCALKMYRKKYIYIYFFLE